MQESDEFSDSFGRPNRQEKYFYAKKSRPQKDRQKEFDE
jgi:hypothetical protein